MFLVAALGLLVLVSGFVLYPLWRAPKREHAAAETQERRADLEVEREECLQALRDLEADRARGVLEEEDYQRLREQEAARLAQVLAQLEVLPQDSSSSPGGERRVVRGGLSWAVASVWLVVILGSTGLYLHLRQTPGEFPQAQEAAAPPPPSPTNPSSRPPMTPEEMVARLEARLQENPNDLEGQVMAGRSYMALRKYDKARKAWQKVLELSPGNAEAHYSLGIILLQEALGPRDRALYQEALNHFDAALRQAGDVPAALYYRGVALIHLDRYQEAEKSWKQALSLLDPDSEDAQFLREELQRLQERQSSRSQTAG